MADLTENPPLSLVRLPGLSDYATKKSVSLLLAILLSGLAAIFTGCHKTYASSYFTLESSTTTPQDAPLSVGDANAPPLIGRGQPGSWDSSDVLNPSVIRFRGKLYNLFSGYDGTTWRTGVATSDDGKTWAMYPRNPVLSPGGAWDTKYIAANGSAIVWKHRVLYFYQGENANNVAQIGLAVSTDGVAFTKQSEPVLTPGDSHTWDGNSVGDPYVIEHDKKLYMYYLGMDDSYTQRLGVAESTDGIHWTKFIENPILDVGAKGSFDENGLGEPSVIYDPPYFYMLYTGRARTEVRDIGWAVSSDGVHWKKMTEQGLFGKRLRTAWDSKVICDTTLLRNDDGSVSVWFGGGDIAAPAQGLHGQIGEFSLNLPKVPESYDANRIDPNVSATVLAGSWAPDGNPGELSAWVGPHASVVLSRPSIKDGLIISGWMPYSFHAKAGHTQPVTITVSINGNRVITKDFHSDSVFTITVPPADVQKAVVGSDLAKVVIDTDSSFVPSEIGHSPDSRRLSLKISKVTFK